MRAICEVDPCVGQSGPLFKVECHWVVARVFGSLLTWLNDHESDVFLVGTCNDAGNVPPEFARAELTSMASIIRRYTRT